MGRASAARRCPGAPTKFAAFHVMPNRCSWGMSSGIPSSHVLTRWTAARRANDHAPGSERSRAGRPEPLCTGHVAGVRLAPDDEHVDVVLLHLGEHSRAPGDSQSRVIGTNFGDRHSRQKGS